MHDHEKGRTVAVVWGGRRIGKTETAKREAEARRRELRISEILTGNPTLTRAEAERMLEAARSRCASPRGMTRARRSGL